VHMPGLPLSPPLLAPIRELYGMRVSVFLPLVTPWSRVTVDKLAVSHTEGGT
jgi:hypothetical protein